MTKLEDAKAQLDLAVQKEIDAANGLKAAAAALSGVLDSITANGSYVLSAKGLIDQYIAELPPVLTPVQAFLKNFKLTLPDASEILNPALQTYSSQYFQPKENSIVFTVPVVGKTTATASNIRTELRGLIENSYKESFGGQFDFIVHQFVDASNTKVVVGQRHDAKQPMFKLVAEKDKLRVLVKTTDNATKDFELVLGTYAPEQRTLVKYHYDADHKILAFERDGKTFAPVAMSLGGVNGSYYEKVGAYEGTDATVGEFIVEQFIP